MAYKRSNDFELIGKRINDIEVLSIAGYKGNPPRTYYKVKCCRCGKIFEMRRNKFFDKVRPPVACDECIHNKFNNPYYINEIIGKKVNKLTCIKFDHFREVKVSGRTKPKRQAMYLCKCDCGNTTIVERNAFIHGDIKSCGCVSTIGVIKHGESQSRLYTIWQDMKNRCYNPNIPKYNQYGGREIYICPEWLGNTPEEGYINFSNWAKSNGYKDDLTIDRINVNGPYAPWNCRWATNQEQSWNKTTSIRIDVGKESLSCLDLCNRFNLSISASELSRRISNDEGDYDNWSLNDKMFVPIGTRRDTYRKKHNITSPIIFEK